MDGTKAQHSATSPGTSTVRLVEACAVGAAVTVAAFFVGLPSTDVVHALQYDVALGEMVGKQWASTLISPHTWTFSLAVSAAGALLGLLAALLRARRRLKLALVSAGALIVTPMIYCVVWQLTSQGQSPGQALIIGAISGLWLLVAYGLTMIPGLALSSLALERWTRPDHPPRRLTRGCVWVASALLLLAASTQAYLPPRPDDRVERLLLQLAGKRCDERGARTYNIAWRALTVDLCRADAVRQLGELGPAASAAVPHLIRLVTAERDRDTGDGFTREQSDPAWALGEIGDRRAIGALTRALQVKDTAGALVGRRAITAALTRIQQTR
jgi:PBS lyase HEAT-like repeat